MSLEDDSRRWVETIILHPRYDKRPRHKAHRIRLKMNYIISDKQLVLLDGAEGHLEFTIVDGKARLRVFGMVDAVSIDLEPMQAA